MKMYMIFIVMIWSCLFISCGASKRAPISEINKKSMDVLVQSKSFEIKSDWASPIAANAMNIIANSGLLPSGNTANRISLLGNSNYLKIMNDSVAAYVPYYGERRMGGAYGGTGNAIEFEGKPKKYTAIWNAKQQQYQLYFEIYDKENTTEFYKVSITIYSNFNCSMHINSAHRNSISYQGSILKLKEKQ